MSVASSPIKESDESFILDISGHRHYTIEWSKRSYGLLPCALAERGWRIASLPEYVATLDLLRENSSPLKQLHDSDFTNYSVQTSSQVIYNGKRVAPGDDFSESPPVVEPTERIIPGLLAPIVVKINRPAYLILNFSQNCFGSRMSIPRVLLILSIS